MAKRAFYKSARFVRLMVAFFVFVPILVFYNFYNKTPLGCKIFKKLNYFTGSRLGAYTVSADEPADSDCDGDCGGCCSCAGDDCSDDDSDSDACEGCSAS